MLGTVHYASTYLRFARAYMLQYNKKNNVFYCTYLALKLKNLSQIDTE